MFSWLQENSGTIIVSLILVIIVAVILFFMIRNRKRGKSVCSCGGDCSRCRAGCRHSS